MIKRCESITTGCSTLNKLTKVTNNVMIEQDIGQYTDQNE